MGRRKLTDAPDHSGGVKATARWQGRAKQDTISNWRDPPRPDAKAAEQGSHITEDTGKVVEDERESEGSIGAMKRSNVRGAKGPCCL